MQHRTVGRVARRRTLAGFLSVAAVVTVAGIASSINGVSSAATTTYSSAAIKSALSGLVLDVNNWSTADGAGIIQYGDHGGSNQRWRFSSIDDDPGYFFIVNNHSGKCLEVPGSSKVSMTKLDQWSCNFGANQRWRLVPSGSYSMIINKSSGQAIDITNWSTVAGTPVQQYPPHGGTNQLFSIVQDAGGPSGQPVPTGSLPGWTQILAEDFKSGATSTQFDTTYANSWCGYADGTGGKYYKSVISAHDGVMDFSLDGVKGAAGSFGPPATCWGKIYSRYSIRFKVVGAADNGTAMMIWPSSNIWGDGEIDYPEGNFGKTMWVFHHGVGCGNSCGASDSLDTGVTWTSWHTATTEWLPGSVKYYLDGVLIKTVTHDIPSTKHRMTIQMAPLTTNAQPGHLLVDWVAQWNPV